VTTKRLNEQTRRNRQRFPGDFMFKLTVTEAQLLKNQFVNWESQESSIRSQFATASKRNRRYLPYAFTEHGALMAAAILNSERAVAMSVYVIRAFVRMREILATNPLFQKRLAEVEKLLLDHNFALKDLYAKIRPLLLPFPEKPKRKIGFHAD
jgi:hypothetical protein